MLPELVLEVWSLELELVLVLVLVAQQLVSEGVRVVRVAAVAPSSVLATAFC